MSIICSLSLSAARCITSLWAHLWALSATHFQEGAARASHNIRPQQLSTLHGNAIQLAMDAIYGSIDDGDEGNAGCGDKDESESDVEDGHLSDLD